MYTVRKLFINKKNDVTKLPSSSAKKYYSVMKLNL